jgi:hypothetical protein
LIVLNAILIFILINKPHQKRENRHQRDFLITQLQFSESQKELFRDLDVVHRAYMSEIDQEVRKNKDLLFKSLSEKNINIDSITTIIGSLEAKKEAEVFFFFGKVRALCSEKQIINFDQIIHKALRGGREHPPREHQNPPRR